MSDSYQSDLDEQGMTSAPPDAPSGGYVTNMPNLAGRPPLSAPDRAFIRSQQFPNDKNVNSDGQYDPILDGRYTNDNDADTFRDVGETFEDD